MDDDRSSWHSFIYNSGIRIAIIGVLAILALFLVAQTIAVASTFGRAGAPATDTITVEGRGEATAVPDVARVSFTVENTAAAVSEAQAKTTEQADAAFDLVKAQGIAEKDIRTLAYDIAPRYSYPAPCTDNGPCVERAPKIVDYRVAQTVEVTVRDLSSVGALLEGLGKVEVQNISGPSFALDDESAGYDAAREDAIAEAKMQASRLAKELGVRLGKIVTFSEVPEESARPYYAAGKASSPLDMAVPMPEVPIGENTYRASVSITYEIR
jgi:uncharacterized protein YggE